ncbi:DUF192 domain-containing protein [Streptomyces lydicus]|uniref:DUF192 domain-containing protein n=1 Tax=Streptomyces lydicus TaxID=47763 RepID=UPI0036F16C99
MAKDTPERIATLCVDGRFVGTVTVATGIWGRAGAPQGLDRASGALLLSPASLAHTLGAPLPIDIAYLDDSYQVLEVCTMPPWRIARPRMRSRHILQAAGGRWRTWQLRPGSTLLVNSVPRYSA